MLNYAELMQLIETRLGKTENGQKITGPDVRAVVEALLDGLTQDGEKLPPYAAANPTLGKIPVLADSGFVDSSLQESQALGAKILSTSSAWQWGGNAFCKSFIVAFTGASRQETTLRFPRGDFGMANIEVRVVGWGATRGVLKMQYGIDTTNAVADYVTVLQAEGNLPSELYITDTEYTNPESIGVKIYQKSAAAKQYLVEVSVVGSVDFLEAIFAQEALASPVTTTARSSTPARGVATPPDSLPVQMSVTKDASGLKLMGDNATPSANKMYGTDDAGQKGWQTVPSPTVQMSVTKDASGLKLVGDNATPSANKMYGTDDAGQKGWQTVPSPTVQMSVTKDASGLKLVGDNATPNINQMYGTNSVGQKGWWDVPTPIRVLSRVYNGTTYSSTTAKQTLITLAAGGVTLADGNVLEAVLVGEVLQNSGVAGNFTFEVEIAHSGGTTTQAFAAESFATNASVYVCEWRIRLTKRTTGIYVLANWQASRAAGGIWEMGGLSLNIASQLTVNSIKINGTMAFSSAQMTMTPHIGWLTLI